MSRILILEPLIISLAAKKFLTKQMRVSTFWVQNDMGSKTIQVKKCIISPKNLGGPPKKDWFDMDRNLSGVPTSPLPPPSLPTYLIEDGSKAKSAKMEKMKSVPNWMKWQENWAKFLPSLTKKRGTIKVGYTTHGKNIKRYYLKWWENLLKTSFGIFTPTLVTW